MKVLLFGASGFIGRHIREALAADPRISELICLGRDRYDELVRLRLKAARRPSRSRTFAASQTPRAGPCPQAMPRSCARPCRPGAC